MNKEKPPLVAFRKPRLEDGAKVHALVDECKPLDLNSTYAYLLLCTHFADTCAVAERDQQVVGFVSGYRQPLRLEVLFIWQVAVSGTVRTKGVGKQLLREVLGRPCCREVRFLETTISPSNEASWGLFRSLARERGAECSRRVLFESKRFGSESHEDEVLLRIGPFTQES